MSDLHSDLAAAQHALNDLQRHVRVLRGRLGDSLDVRRVAGDVDRLAESLAVLHEIVPAAGAPPVRQLEVIPDGDYDPSFWQDAEDEGLGARDRHAP